MTELNDANLVSPANANCSNTRRSWTVFAFKCQLVNVVLIMQRYLLINDFF